MYRLLTLVLILSGCGTTEVLEPAPPIIYPEPTREPPPVQPPSSPGFITRDLIEEAIDLDLKSISSQTDREDTRYFSSCHRANTGKETDTHYQAINLGWNRLSDQRFLEKSVRISNLDCIYRIALSDYGKDASDWRLLERRSIFDFESETIRSESLKFLTQTAKPYLWTEELCTVFECDDVSFRNGDTYYQFTRQNNSIDLFYSDLGADIQEQADDQTTVCAAFQESQIALSKGRLICIYETVAGYVMSTYDTFLGNDTVFINPFTKEIALGGGTQYKTQKVLQFDGQEHIASNLNGLFGIYRLNDSEGSLAGVAPTNLVSNTLYPAIDPAIRAAGDCGACHYSQTAIPFTDEMGLNIESNTRFNAQEKLFGRIFFSNDKMQAIASTINRTENQARAELGIDHDVDPLSTQVFLPIRREIGVDMVASLVMMTTEEFLIRLQGAAISSQELGNLTLNGTVSLETLSGIFATLVDETNAFRDDEL